MVRLSCLLHLVPLLSISLRAFICNCITPQSILQARLLTQKRSKAQELQHSVNSLASETQYYTVIYNIIVYCIIEGIYLGYYDENT